MCIWSHQAEGRDTTFIMGHALLKKAILHLKRANGRFILQGAVHTYFGFLFLLPFYRVLQVAHAYFIIENFAASKIFNYEISMSDL